MNSLRRVLAALLVLALIFAVAFLILLPAWLEGRLILVLRDLGLDDVRLTVAGVRLDGATILDVKLGESDRVLIPSVEIRYTLSGLMRSEIESVRLSGLKCSLERRQDQWDWQPWSRLRLSGGGAGWSLHRLDVVDAQLRIHDNGQIHQVEFDIHEAVLHASGFACHVQAANRDFSQLARVRARVEGTFDAAAMMLRVTPDPRPATAAAPPSDPPDLLRVERWRVRPDFATSVTIPTGRIDVVIPLGKPSEWRASTDRLPLMLSVDGLSAMTFQATAWANHDGAKATVSLAQPMDWKHSLAQGRVRALHADLQVDYGSGSIAWTRHAGSFDFERVDWPGAGVVIRELKGDFPGDFQAGAIESAVRDWGGVKGRIETAGDALKLTGLWKPHEALPVKLSATVRGDGTADFGAELEPRELVDSRAIGSIVPGLGEIEIDGGMAGKVAGQWRDRKLQATGRIDLEDATVQARRWDVSAVGVRGSIVIDDLFAGRSAPEQTLTGRWLQIGAVTLGEPTIRFRIDSPRRGLLEHISCKAGASGRLSASAVNLDLDDPNIQTDLWAEDVNLGDWLSVLTQEKIGATGQVYGRLPIRYRPSQRSLDLSGGFLYSKPEGGTLRVGEPGKLVDLLGQWDPRFARGGELEQVRDQAAASLRDYDYALFRFDLVPEGAGQTLRIETRARRQSGPDAPVVGSLVVNVRRFDQAVHLFMNGQLKLTPDQSVDRMLERFFQNPAP